jgi:hypothetical protein
MPLQLKGLTYEYDIKFERVFDNEKIKIFCKCLKTNREYENVYLKSIVQEKFEIVRSLKNYNMLKKMISVHVPIVTFNEIHVTLLWSLVLPYDGYIEFEFHANQISREDDITKINKLEDKVKELENKQKEFCILERQHESLKNTFIDSITSDILVNNPTLIAQLVEHKIDIQHSKTIRNIVYDKFMNGLYGVHGSNFLKSHFYTFLQKLIEHGYSLTTECIMFSDLQLNENDYPPLKYQGIQVSILVAYVYKQLDIIDKEGAFNTLIDVLDYCSPTADFTIIYGDVGTIIDFCKIQSIRFTKLLRDATEIAQITEYYYKINKVDRIIEHIEKLSKKLK